MLTVKIGDPDRGRTCDLQIRNLPLYPLSYGIVIDYEWMISRYFACCQVCYNGAIPPVYA